MEDEKTSTVIPDDMSVIIPPKSFREPKVFRRRVLPAVLGFLVVAWIGGTLMSRSGRDETAPTSSATPAPNTAVSSSPAPKTTFDAFTPHYDCPKEAVPAGARYEWRDLFDYYEVLGPDGYGNVVGIGVTLFEGGPVYADTACARQEILLGPSTDKIEVLKLCEVKPFPTGQHLEYMDAGDGISSFVVIGPDGIPESSGVSGFVVDGEQTVYDTADCARVAASTPPPKALGVRTPSTAVTNQQRIRP